MERKKLHKLIVPVLIAAALVIALLLYIKHMNTIEKVPIKTTDVPVPVSGPAGLSPDETVILSHLPDQQVGVKYPKGETIKTGDLSA